MKTLVTCLFLLFCMSASAQNNTVSISIKFKNEAGETVLLKYGELAPLAIVLNNKGEYSGKITVNKGYYTLINRGNALRVYMEPGINLAISKKGNKGYTFSKKESAEYTFLKRLAVEQAKYLPLNGDQLTDEVNFIEPANFIARLDQYKASSLKMLAQNSLSDSFNSIEAAYIDCLARRYALQYMENYGVNAEKKKEYLKNLVNGDESLSTPNGKQAALNAVYVKGLTYDDRRAVFSKVYNGFDTNNEALYKCSAEYSDFVDGWVNYLAKTGGDTEKSFAMRRIDFIKTAITNEYIKQQLLQMYKGDI